MAKENKVTNSNMSYRNLTSKDYINKLVKECKENKNIEIHLKDNSAYSFGYMIYFFMRACGMSCYLLGINPFNQPGVEVYKKEMFKLLGKE